MIKNHHPIVYFFLILLSAIPYCLQAASTCSQTQATIISIQGKVDAQSSKDVFWSPIKSGHNICSGDKIRTSKHSRATLVFKNGFRTILRQNSTLRFPSATEKETSWIIRLMKGSGLFIARESQRVNILTPFISFTHEGTEFLVTVDSQQTEITVFDGQVAASNQMGNIRIKKGYTGIATKNQPPTVQALTIRLEDAVQWSLYYPPIINVSSLKPVFQSSIEAFQKGNSHQALTFLEQTALSKQDSAYLTYKSSLLLTLGSVGEAQSLINQTLLKDPENSSAIALQSIIAVAKNRQDKALNLAQKAVTLDPQSATAQIALSYAYQAHFKVSEALTATKKAVRLSPDNALAWARLAELQLSTGERSDALTSAQKAESLNPTLGRTQTVLGFNYLAQTDIDPAKNIFIQAIKLNSADPLAHLGLGLAKIRKGAIEEGTRDIEIAVSLDPGNAIMRSYLGKAYYELRNDGYAGTELNIAKEMDPNDPTSWFYDAIRKQTTNRPAEALHDMQKAIELNDNRGIYRSKLLLDEDLAARSASLGRIYNDLGFQQLGLVEGWNSISNDPSNYSAHRLLADNYSALPRHEIARVSELLQSQLLQPMNMTPVQPQLAESTLLTLNNSGPSNLSFNEFNPIYTKNQFSLQTSAIIGDKGTWGDEVIQSGLWDNFSYSLGQFHYETNGYRENNDIEQDLYNAFVQYRITPDFSIQAEYRRSEINRGDIDINFNNSFSTDDRFELKQDTVRFGSHFKASTNSDFLLSLIYNKHKVTPTSYRQIFETITEKTIIDNEEDGYQAEIRYLYNNSIFKLTAGAGASIVDGDQNITQRLLADPCPFPTCQRSFQGNIKTRHYNGYIYSDIIFSKDLIGTVGLSLDSFESTPLEYTSLNPKFGLKWQVVDNVLLRMAAFKTLKRVLLVDQTVEPTQIAGFNQFYDDFNGTKSFRYGVGLDIDFTRDFKGGLEVSIREIRKPIVSLNNTGKETVIFGDQQEELYKSYLYWTPSSNFAISLEPQYEIYKTKEKFTSGPINLKTFSLPLSVRHFNEFGFFSNISLTYLQQDVEYQNTSLSKNEEQVFILDMGIGFRLPKRLGLINIEVNNILDERYQFQDNNFRLPLKRKRISRFVPDRSITAKVTINF